MSAHGKCPRIDIGEDTLSLRQVELLGIADLQGQMGMFAVNEEFFSFADAQSGAIV